MSRQIPAIFSGGETTFILGKKGLPRLFFKAMRPHQWTKNLFVFAPLLFGKKLTEPEIVGYALLAFAVFCCLASALYIFNDWMDADEDRTHPEKCLRPISSGALPAPVALTGAAILLAAAFGIAFFIGTKFLLVAAFYFVLMLGYCLVLKRLPVLDCMTIATGFVLRVGGGAFAVGVMPTHWLIVCAFLLALFLAFTKRRQELLTLTDQAGAHRKVLNEYTVGYLEQINNILVAATIVCYALYTVAPETIARFETDKLIYGTIFVIYGMFRYLALIKDSANGGNPSRMFLRDKSLLATVAGWAFYNAAMIYQTAAYDLWKRLF